MHYHRMLRLIVITLAAATATLAVQAPALAAAPFKKAQAPGFYRMKLGDFEVTALLDGATNFPPQYLRADVKDLQPVLDKQLTDGDHMAGAVSGFLVNTGKKLILVDTGTGGFWGGPILGLGKLVANLKKSGYRPEQVDIVLLTHLHADHAGGIATPTGKRAFPNAVVRMGKADSDFWLSEEIAKQAPKEAQEFFKLARSSAKPYIAAKKWIPLVGTDEIVDGVRPYPIGGHTPGHMGYEFTSKGQTMLAWGDVIHAAPVQFERPDIGVVFDVDGPAAIKTRQELFATLAANQTLVAGAHTVFPSLGRLRKEGTGYVWVPVPYTDKP
jgi:glyoxylase-like metal-dependent hydrolase (beta-lactamase superfamily II)